MTLTDLTPPRSAHPLGGLPVAIIGAGPIGLAAAAHLVELGIDFVISRRATSPPAPAVGAHPPVLSLVAPLDPAERLLLAADRWAHPTPTRPRRAPNSSRSTLPLAGETRSRGAPARA